MVMDAPEDGQPSGLHKNLHTLMLPGVPAVLLSHEHLQMSCGERVNTDARD